MRVSILGSGSRGNAILVEAGATRVLVDVGFGVRTLAKRLAAVGCPPESITGVVLTHEHVDHAQGAVAACAKWQWPLYATAGTLHRLPALPALLAPVRTLTHGQPWSVGDLHGASFAVPHDAADCAALVFEHAVTGQRIGIALDLGHVPTALPAALCTLDLLVIESNHDRQQLMAGPYPWPLKQRILGPFGHLSNSETAELVATCAHRGLRAVILAHLSETNNTPELAVNAVRSALLRRGSRASSAREHMYAATQRVPLGPITCRGSKSARVGQLEFSL